MDKSIYFVSKPEVERNLAEVIITSFVLDVFIPGASFS